MYTAAESNALVKIVPVGVVVPFDAVQKDCRAGQQRDAGKKTIATISVRGRGPHGPVLYSDAYPLVSLRIPDHDATQ